MNKVNHLPKITQKKKITKKEFFVLAKKVKKIFEEEEKYINDGYNQSTQFFISN